MSIQCQDSNSQPSEHESPPITTRPGLPPSINICLCIWQPKLYLGTRRLIFCIAKNTIGFADGFCTKFCERGRSCCCCCYHNLHFFQLSFHSIDPPFSFETSSQSRLSFFIKRASATHNRQMQSIMVKPLWLIL